MTTSPASALCVALLATLLIVPSAAADEGPSKTASEPARAVFSPFPSPLDFKKLTQSPTRTDRALTACADVRFPGCVVVGFGPDVELDADSLHVNGKRALGVDPSAIQLTYEIPGVGAVAVPMHVDVEGPFIVCHPLPPYATAAPDGTLTTDLPEGQYTLGVFRGLRNARGRPVVRAPLFHTFLVGMVDRIAPRVLTTSPVSGQQEVPAGLAVHAPVTPEVVIRFTEPVDPATIGSKSIVVRDRGAFVPGGGSAPVVVPAAGYPRVRADSGACEVVWRADADFGGFAYGTKIEVSVGLGEVKVRDLSGNAMEAGVRFSFETAAPPALPTAEIDLAKLQSEIEVLRKRLEELEQQLRAAHR